MFIRRLTFIAGLIGYAALLTACADITPRGPLSNQESPSTGAPPTHTGQSLDERWKVLPGIAFSQDSRGATIIAQFALELLPHVYAGDRDSLEIWRLLSADYCVACDEARDKGLAQSAQGLELVGGDVRLISDPQNKVVDHLHPEVAFVLQRIVADAWEVHDARGNVVDSGAAVDVIMIVRLDLNNGSWQVVSFYESPDHNSCGATAIRECEPLWATEVFHRIAMPRHAKRTIPL